MSDRTQSPPSQSEDSVIERPDPRLALRRRLQRPDTSDPEFIAEARRQSQEIANCPHEAEEMAFIESISIPFDELD